MKTNTPKHRPALSIALCCLAGSLLSSTAAAQDAISVEQLKRGFSGYSEELVTLRGWVATERRVASTTFKGYYLRDRFGALILVRTVNPLPDITAEIQVSGVALRDADTRDIYISEHRRSLAGKTAEDTETKEAQRLAAIRTAELERKRLDDQRNRNLLAAGGGAAVLLALGGFLFVRRRGRVQESLPPFSAEGYAPAFTPPPAAPEPAAPPSVDDFKTVRVYKTTKVLPGKLTVLEEGKEADVIHLSDQSGKGEIEIGRDSPDSQGGIRIKDRTNTLSRRQAKIVFLSDRRISARQPRRGVLQSDHSRRKVARRK